MKKLEFNLLSGATVVSAVKSDEQVGRMLDHINSVWSGKQPNDKLMLEGEPELHINIATICMIAVRNE